MLRRTLLAAAVPAAIGLVSFVGSGTVSASANLVHADCIGIAASTANAVEGHGAGGALIAGLANTTVGVGLYARTDCATLPGTGGGTGGGSTS